MPGNLIPPVFMLGRLEPSGFNALGTAFAVMQDKIATAFHVVGASDQNLVMIIPNIDSIEEYQDTSVQQFRTLPMRVCAADPVLDLCVLQAPPGTTIGSHCKLSSTDAIPPGTPVTSYGFPHANHNRIVLTLQTARVGARILIESAGVKTRYRPKHASSFRTVWWTSFPRYDVCWRLCSSSWQLRSPRRRNLAW